MQFSTNKDKLCEQIVGLMDDRFKKELLRFAEIAADESFDYYGLDEPADRKQALEHLGDRLEIFVLDEMLFEGLLSKEQHDKLANDKFFFNINGATIYKKAFGNSLKKCLNYTKAHLLARVISKHRGGGIPDVDELSLPDFLKENLDERAKQALIRFAEKEVYEQSLEIENYTMGKDGRIRFADYGHMMENINIEIASKIMEHLYFLDVIKRSECDNALMQIDSLLHCLKFVSSLKGEQIKIPFNSQEAEHLALGELISFDKKGTKGTFRAYVPDLDDKVDCDAIEIAQDALLDLSKESLADMNICCRHILMGCMERAGKRFIDGPLTVFNTRKAASVALKEADNQIREKFFSFMKKEDGQSLNFYREQYEDLDGLAIAQCLLGCFPNEEAVCNFYFHLPKNQ